MTVDQREPSMQNIRFSTSRTYSQSEVDAMRTAAANHGIDDLTIKDTPIGDTGRLTVVFLRERRTGLNDLDRAVKQDARRELRKEQP